MNKLKQEFLVSQRYVSGTILWNADMVVVERTSVAVYVNTYNLLWKNLPQSLRDCVSVEVHGEEL